MNRGIIKNKWSSIALKSKAVLRPNVRQMAWKCKTWGVTKHCSITKYLYYQNTAWNTRVVITQTKSLQLHNMSLAIRMLVNYPIFQSLLKISSHDSAPPRYKGCSCSATRYKGLGLNMAKSCKFHYPFSDFFTKFSNRTITRPCPKPTTLNAKTATLQWPLCHICM